MSKIQAIRGMNDILPTETPLWQYLEQVIAGVTASYGYEEIRFPILEQTQLFKRSIGEITDIVEKEMYTFDDRNGDSLTLRPEGTAGCVRAAEQHGLLYNQQQRFWYQGPMFRHERPQKGRYRQFYQYGIEAFGMSGPDIDAEVIMLSARLWKKLGIDQHLSLEINNIGSAEDRAEYGKQLTGFLESHRQQLDGDSQRRLSANPLRILDSKVPATQDILANAPRLSGQVNSESGEYYDELKRLLTASGIHFSENPNLVRGLDYYNNCVFEWKTDHLGAQGTVCAGGRYDGLVAQLGGKPVPAVGFAGGMERLILLLEVMQPEATPEFTATDVYLVLNTDQTDALEQALLLAENLREVHPGTRFRLNCGGGKYNAQLKRAFASGARAAIILDPGFSTGEDAIRLRVLTENGPTQTVNRENLSEWIREVL